MAIALTPPETQETIHSLKKYFAAEMDAEISDLKARLLLDYIIKEIAPFAYNQGVKDAEVYFRGKLEDLPATCFEPSLQYWVKRRK